MLFITLGHRDVLSVIVKLNNHNQCSNHTTIAVCVSVCVCVCGRFVEVDRNTGIHEMRQADAQDAYPVCVLTDDPRGLQGSCVFFSERLDVCEQIRAPLTLEEVQTR